MKPHISSHPLQTLAATVAPEDLRCGEYVALLNMIGEQDLPVFCERETGGVQEPVRIRWMSPGAGQPYRVKAICLPFVFLRKCSSGKYRTIDVRRVQLVRLDRGYAKFVTKALRVRRDQSQPK